MARPRTGQTPVRHVRVDDKLWGQVEEIAGEQETSASAVVIEALKRYVASRKRMKVRADPELNGRPELRCPYDRQPGRAREHHPATRARHLLYVPLLITVPGLLEGRAPQGRRSGRTLRRPAILR